MFFFGLLGVLSICCAPFFTALPRLPAPFRKFSFCRVLFCMLTEHKKRSFWLIYIKRGTRTELSALSISFVCVSRGSPDFLTENLSLRSPHFFTPLPDAIASHFRCARARAHSKTFSYYIYIFSNCSPKIDFNFVCHIGRSYVCNFVTLYCTVIWQDQLSSVAVASVGPARRRQTLSQRQRHSTGIAAFGPRQSRGPRVARITLQSVSKSKSYLFYF